jgi:hypothetical protein
MEVVALVCLYPRPFHVPSSSHQESTCLRDAVKEGDEAQHPSNDGLAVYHCHDHEVADRHLVVGRWDGVASCPPSLRHCRTWSWGVCRH